jgi:hypothetical protein
VNTDMHSPHLFPEDVERLEQVIDDTPAAHASRATLLGRAAAMALAGAAVAPATASAASMNGDSIKTVIDTAVTAEALAVTYLSAVIEHAKGTKVEPFVDVLKAANQAEYDHYKVLTSLGAKPLTLKFWAPNDFFGPNLKDVFPTIEVAETLFVNAYLIGTTVFAKAGKADLARYACEICGVEAQHRTLARYAQGKLPDNRAFEDASIHTMSGIVAALEHVGVGFGKKGTKPGQFVTFKPPGKHVTTPITNPAPM